MRALLYVSVVVPIFYCWGCSSTSRISQSASAEQQVPVESTHALTASAEQQISAESIQALTAKHQYELSVVGFDGNPLEGVTIRYTLTTNGQLTKSDSFVTQGDGRLETTVLVPPDTRPNADYIAAIGFHSMFSYEVSKEGHGFGSGQLPQKTMMPRGGSTRYLESLLVNPTTLRGKIKLVGPLDYFSNQFLYTLTDIELKTRLLTFIDSLLLQSHLTSSTLNYKSIDLVPFKQNRYLQFHFTNTNVYNSLKSNKYDIGKTLFDEVIRKVLTPLNMSVGGSRLFFGYDLTVTGYTKSFLDDTDSAVGVEYRFLIPEDIARQYKEKDISGQQVLDSSIILMDDERIELKLQ